MSVFVVCGLLVSVFVLDCSVAAAWLFEDAASPETARHGRKC